MDTDDIIACEDIKILDSLVLGFDYFTNEKNCVRGAFPDDKNERFVNDEGIRPFQIYDKFLKIEINPYLYQRNILPVSTQRKKRLYVFSNIIGYLAMLVVNGLANALPLNHKTTGELADALPNLFVPAGITFSIWGVIYLLLAVLLIYQLYSLLSQEIATGLSIVRIGWWFVVSCILNVSWIFAWHYQVIWLSLIIMLMLLCTLIVIYRRLDIGGCCANCNEKVFIFLPFSLYLGWISVATVANATAFLVSLGWGRWGFSEVFWVVMVLAFLTALTITVLFTRKDFAFAMAILWALTGIVIKRSAAPGGQERLTVYAATAGIVLIALAVLVQFFRKKKYS